MLLMQLLSSRLAWVGVAIVGLIGSHVGAYQAGWFRGAAAERAVWQAERSRVLAEATVTAERLRGEGRRLAAELELAKATVRTEYVERLVQVREAASATRACFTPRTAAALNRSAAAPDDPAGRLSRDAVIRERVERPGTPDAVIEHRAEVEAGGTSERAAAEWIAGAQAAHEACRAQVGALADWIRAVTGGRS